MSAAQVRIAVLVALLGGAAAGYGAAIAGWGPVGDDLARQARLARAQDEALTLARQTNLVLQAERDRREGERMIEFATRQSLEKRVQEQDAELAQLHDRVAFYEQLLPAGPPGTISIRAASLEPVANGLRYRVLLMRSGRAGDATFSGTLQFVAEGTQDGEDRSVELTPMQVGEATSSDTPSTSVAPRDTLALNFDQFQRSQGLLALPEGFVPRRVVVNVLEGSVVRATQTTTLP